MAEMVQSLDELDILFANIVQSRLGLPNGKVLISYSQRGQVSSRIDEDICYLKVFDEPDERHIWKNRTSKNLGDNMIQSQWTMRTLLVHLVFYGPNADSLSTRMLEAIYYDSTKQYLKENNLAFIPDMTVQPQIHYEKINEQFWHRSDLKLYFYNSVKTEDTLEIIDNVEFIIKR